MTKILYRYLPDVFIIGAGILFLYANYRAVCFMLWLGWLGFSGSCP